MENEKELRDEFAKAAVAGLMVGDGPFGREAEDIAYAVAAVMPDARGE